MVFSDECFALIQNGLNNGHPLVYRTIKYVVRQILHSKGFPGCSHLVMSPRELFIEALDVFHISPSVYSQYTDLHIDSSFTSFFSSLSFPIPQTTCHTHTSYTLRLLPTSLYNADTVRDLCTILSYCFFPRGKRSGATHRSGFIPCHCVQSVSLNPVCCRPFRHIR